MSWTRKTIRVADVAASHAVEKGRKIPVKYANDPILVKKRWLGGYRIHDGNARLERAVREGRKHIDAEVWGEES